MEKVLDAYQGFEALKLLVHVGAGIVVSLGFITSMDPHVKAINLTFLVF